MINNSQIAPQPLKSQRHQLLSRRQLRRQSLKNLTTLTRRSRKRLRARLTRLHPRFARPRAPTLKRITTLSLHTRRTRFLIITTMPHIRRNRATRLQTTHKNTPQISAVTPLIYPRTGNAIPAPEREKVSLRPNLKSGWGRGNPPPQTRSHTPARQSGKSPPPRRTQRLQNHSRRPTITTTSITITMRRHQRTQQRATILQLLHMISSETPRIPRRQLSINRPPTNPTRRPMPTSMRPQPPNPLPILPTITTTQLRHPNHLNYSTHAKNGTDSTELYRDPKQQTQKATHCTSARSPDGYSLT